MNQSQAITILTELMNNAIRVRDDRANRFSEVVYEHLHPDMRAYIEEQRDKAILQVQAYELAIVALQNAQFSPTVNVHNKTGE
jgi:hypothetical protein